MSLLTMIDLALGECKQQCQAEKPWLSSNEYKAIMGAIPRLRKHLKQGYYGYKGKAYPEIRARLVLDARRYYGECVADYLGKNLPDLVGNEGEIVESMW